MDGNKMIPVADWMIFPIDALNWVAAQPKLDDNGVQKTDTNGKLMWKRNHYFPKLEMAFAFVLTKRIDANTRDDVKSVLHAIEAARNEVVAAVIHAKGAAVGESSTVEHVSNVTVYDIG